MRPEREDLVHLSLVEGVGSARLGTLLETFGSAGSVLSASLASLKAAPGVGPVLARRIREAARSSTRPATRALLRNLAASGIQVVAFHDPGYPAPFRSLSEPPYLLYLAGRSRLLDHPSVALVGTRYPTAYGREVAARLAADLADAGICVVSGMARGIDGAAHAGALRARGDTIGVLGHGIDQLYPPEAGRLFAAVRRRGLLISEFSPGETPRAGNFPRRNRLIAALSRVVVVVEMSLRSGAQHTVNFALDQGVDVMAVPGPITSPGSAGTNQLIRDGAGVVTDASDILLSMGISASYPAAELSSTDRPTGSVLDAVGGSATHVDAIANAAGLPVAETLRQLLILELKGQIVAEGGNRFRRSGPKKNLDGAAG